MALAWLLYARRFGEVLWAAHILYMFKWQSPTFITERGRLWARQTTSLFSSNVDGGPFTHRLSAVKTCFTVLQCAVEFLKSDFWWWSCVFWLFLGVGTSDSSVFVLKHEPLVLCVAKVLFLTEGDAVCNLSESHCSVCVLVTFIYAFTGSSFDLGMLCMYFQLNLCAFYARTNCDIQL